MQLEQQSLEGEDSLVFRNQFPGPNRQNDGAVLQGGATPNNDTGDLLFANDDFARVELVGPSSEPPPTNITASSQTILENQPPGAAVGTFSTTESGSGHTFTYTLVNGFGSIDNNAFTIAGNVLKAASSFDYEARTNYNIRVRATDEHGGVVREAVR